MEGNLYGLISSVLGVLGTFLFFYYVGFFAGPLAIVFGALGIGRDDYPTMAKVGIGLGILAIFLSVMAFLGALFILGDVFAYFK